MAASDKGKFVDNDSQKGKSLIPADEDRYCKKVTLLGDEIMVLTRKLLQKKKAELDKGKSMMLVEDDMDWYTDEIKEHAEKNAPNMFSIRIHYGGKFQRYPGKRYFDGHVNIFDLVDVDMFIAIALNIMVVQLCYTDSYRRPPPRVRVTIEDITDKPGSITTIEHRSEKMLLLIWHDSSEPTKEPVYDSITPRSLPQHDSCAPCKDSVFESVTPRSMPHSTASRVIEDVMRQLSFKKAELDGEASFADVARSGIESYGLSHDDYVGVDDLDLNLNEHVDLNVPKLKHNLSFSVMLKKMNQLLVMDTSFYDVERIDSAYETQYDVQSSEDASWVPFDNIGVTNLVPDDVLEREDVGVINVDGFDSDHGNDNKTSNYMRKRLAELSREIKGVINASGQWKYSFYIGHKFTTVKEAKDRVYLHFIKSRKNLKLYKNDSVMSTNPNTTIKIVVKRNNDPSLSTRVFQRIYVCLGALKLDFKACRRYLLGLVGAFMKGPFPGQVLTAVGLDSDNGIYPLAYALVEGESRPKKKRKRSKHEDGPFMKDSKLSKKGRTITCQSCRTIRHNKTTCKGQGQKATTGCNNTEASSASRQAQQAEPAVGQDGSGGSGVGAVIGLFVVDYAGGAGVGIGSQGSSQ
nr:putative transposase, mutator type, MULE transposase domain protein [Tanacetum cinerariifolium]